MKKIIPHLALVQVFYLLGVIIWGAFVRATGSGAGCGDHWPLCNGEIVPLDPSWKTIVEFGHRVTSGLSVWLCIAVLIGIRRHFTAGSLQRRAAMATLFFLLIEALIGAAIVKLEHVVDNATIYRGYSMGIHLVNTFFLTAAALMTYHLTIHSNRQFSRATPWAVYGTLFSGACLFLLVGASGAITALGDTLFAPTAGGSVWLEAQSNAAHWLQRTRIYHPFVAIFLYVGAATCGILLYLKDYPLAILRWFYILFGTMTVQALLGYLSIVLLAPTYMQLLHLLGGQLTWLCFVRLSAEILHVEGAARNETRTHF